MKVISYLKSRDRTIPMTDIGSDEKQQQRLIEIGGKKQVPCLLIDGRAMYESDDIIQFLETHL